MLYHPKARLIAKWAALKKLCQFSHVGKATGTTSCVCGMEKMGSSLPCAMLTQLKIFFRDFDPDNPSVYYRDFLSVMKGECV